MPATTKASPADVEAQRIITAAASSLGEAIKLADAAAVRFPEYRFPTVVEGGATPSFADVAAHLRQAQPQGPASVPQEKTAPAKAAPARKATAPRKVTSPRKAAPVKAAPVKAEPAPEPVVTTTLKLVHDGVNQTAIFGTTKGSAATKALGRDGLGWKFWGVAESWYIPATQGYAPNMGLINEAVATLEALTENGQQLYRVETDIKTVGPDGEKLPVKMSKAEAAAWQRSYNSRDNTIYAALQLGRGVCDGCGATGLTEKTGRKAKGDRGLPILQCGTCGGFGAPAVAEPAPATAVDLSALFKAPLALPAAPTVAEESERCPACRTVRKVIDGKFELHTSARGNGPCRGKVGGPATVADVEPEPKTEPVKAARKAAVPAEPVDLDDEVDTAVKFALQGGLSRTSARDLATDLRSTLARQITRRGPFKGVTFSAFLDKADLKFIRVEITGGADGFDAAELDAEIERVAKTVRGIRNRMRKG